MALHSFSLTPARLGKYKGRILKHAAPQECLSRGGRQVEFPANNSDTYVARRFLPYGGTATNANTQNRFFANGSGDRGNVIVQSHQTQEGVTSMPDSLTPQDVQVVMTQYDCLYGFTDKTFHLYEDDIPGEMEKQIGERVTLVNELIIYGALRQCTNVYYGGTGTSIATVNGGMTLGQVRNITRNLKANHGMMVNSALAPSPDFGTDAVEAGYDVYCHTNLEPDARDIEDFTPTIKYGSGARSRPFELGKVETFRLFTTPDLPELQDAGAAVGATGLLSTSGSLIDVYPVLVFARDAWSTVAVRGLSALDPTYLPPGKKDKADPQGQRGYGGTKWWKAVMLENHGWMALLYVGAKQVV